MNKKIFIILSFVVILATIALSFNFYDILPDRFATHWNLAGQADGWSSKNFGLGLFPGLILILSLLFLVLPKIDPINKDFKKFYKQYYSFASFLNIFLFYLFGLTLCWNLGLHFNFGSMLAPALAGLWLVIGLVLHKTERNFFFGIRTPWTLSSDSVWEKTHKLGSKLFILSAVITAFGIFTPFVFWLTIIPVIVSVIITLIYSYLIFEREKKANEI